MVPRAHNTKLLSGPVRWSSDMKLWFFRLTALLLPVAFYLQIFRQAVLAMLWIAIGDEQRFRFAGFIPFPSRPLFFLLLVALRCFRGSYYRQTGHRGSRSVLSILFSIDGDLGRVGGGGSSWAIIGAVLRSITARL